MTVEENAVQLTSTRINNNNNNNSGNSSSSSSSNNINSIRRKYNRTVIPKVTDHPLSGSSIPENIHDSRNPYSGNNYNSNSNINSNINNNNNNNNSNKTTSNSNTIISTITTNELGASSKYDWRMHSLMLCRHILTRGLEDGIGSDITVSIPAWNKTYHLHKLILDQNPYFKLLLQGGFLESTQDHVTLHFEDNHPFVTMESFQFVLEYLYGKIDDPPITTENVCQMLATSSYFHLDLYGICVEYVLKSLNQYNVIDYLLFVDEHMMIQGSERISDAVFTFLCRESFCMERVLLVHLPLDWLQKVIESDAFWVPSEYDRYCFIKEIIQARYDTTNNDKTTTSGIKNSSNSISSKDKDEDDDEEEEEEEEEAKTKKDNDNDSDYDDNNPNDNNTSAIDEDLASFNHILSHSIYYMHMTFEQLESIEKDVNPFTHQPLVSSTVLKEALWMQIRLRSKIESASESDIQLYLTENVKQKNDYPIPTDDTTTYTGESTCTKRSSSQQQQQQQELDHQYSIYPPFRFSVEFNDVPLLKHGMRVYSDTVFYAGSNWNMYIQKTKSQRKNVLQLGVYLHRQSIPSNADEDIQQETSSSSRSTPIENNWTFSRFSDKRKIVKTWFKIYCPARGPKHALTLFQSSPDNFTVLQSWGWRSTTLCADEDALLEENDYTQLNESKASATTLRFSVVMGHV